MTFAELVEHLESILPCTLPVDEQTQALRAILSVDQSTAGELSEAIAATEPPPTKRQRRQTPK